MKYLGIHEIPIRETGIQIRRKVMVGYGKKMKQRNEVIHKKEMETIMRMKELRAKGFTYERISEVLNTIKIPTKTRKGK